MHTKWEYLVTTAHYTIYSDLINDYGEKGWELVQILLRELLNTPKQYILIFKRPCDSLLPKDAEG